ncbi:MAG: hypothetical protein IJ779_01960 [Ruminococcus sp.]|nr:hypothetical protein [Ruminococcus sp.]
MRCNSNMTGSKIKKAVKPMGVTSTKFGLTDLCIFTSVRRGFARLTTV